MVLERAQYRIVDDWHVMGMQGTGSKRIVADDAFVPAQRTICAVAPGADRNRLKRPGLHANPMYLGRIASFLIGESASVAVGAARGALDLYEEVLRVKRTYHPPYHERFREPEFQAHFGRALGLVATAEAALIRAGRGIHGLRARGGAAGEPFGDEKDQRLMLIELQCMRLAWEAVELIYRTVGTSDAAKDGAMIGRIFRNMAVINTHPALQLERTALNAARTRFGFCRRRSVILDRHRGQIVAEMAIDPSEKGGAQLRFIRLVARLDLGGHEVRGARQIDRPGELRMHPMGRIAPLAPAAAEGPASVPADVVLLAHDGIVEFASIARHNLEHFHGPSP